MRYILNDTETIGLNPPPVGSGVVQVAWVELDSEARIIGQGSSLVNPGCDIHPEASKVHGLYADDVKDAPNLEDVYKWDDPVVSIGHNCVTGDHKILTTEGWVRFDTLVGDTVVAAVWGTDNKIKFETCQVLRHDYVGPMLKYSSLFHAGIYTPNHKIVNSKSKSLLNGGTPEWEATDALSYSKVPPNSVVVPSCGLYEPENPLDITPRQARILEAIRADSNIEKYSIRWALTKLRKVERLKNLLDSEGLPYSINLRKDGAYRVALLACAFRNKASALLGSGKGKRLGSWILDLTLEARVAYLDETSYWDGAVFERESSQKNKKQTAISTQHSAEAYWLQIAAITSGFTSKVYIDKPNTRGFSLETSVLSKATIRDRKYVKTLYSPEVVQGRGMVYCLKTSTGAFMVSREGAAWVTGNSSFDVKFLAPCYSNLVGSLCTLSLARQYIPKAPNHKLGTLVEYLELEKRQLHDALADVQSTLDVLHWIMTYTQMPLDKLVKLAAKPKVVYKMPFGKYKDRAIVSLPLDYIRYFDDKEIDHNLRLAFDQQIRLRS